MSLWVLDTDTLTLWLRDHEAVSAKVVRTPPQQLAVTIITVEEILRGWYTQIRRARDDEQLARAYQALQQTVEFIRRIQILPFCKTYRFIPRGQTCLLPASSWTVSPPRQGDGQRFPLHRRPPGNSRPEIADYERHSHRDHVIRHTRDTSSPAPTRATRPGHAHSENTSYWRGRSGAAGRPPAPPCR